MLDTEPLLPAVTVVDRVLQRRMSTASAVLAAPLTPRARAACAHVDGGAQSPRESLLRLALTRAGLPRPVTQGRIVEGGRLVAQVDLVYRRYRVAVEYEGGSISPIRGSGARTSIGTPT